MLARLSTLALPLAVRRSKPIRVVKAMMAKVPVPGPKMPSYRPMASPMPRAMAVFLGVRMPSSLFSSGSFRRQRISTAAMGRMISIIARSISSLSSSTMWDPSALPAKLPTAARMPIFTFMAPFLKKLTVAKVVPQAALNLLVP